MYNNISLERASIIELKKYLIFKGESSWNFIQFNLNSVNVSDSELKKIIIVIQGYTWVRVIK